ncbi:MAG: subclass B1 metallo-beta-lactamase, partial [Eudoraea sp.]|nr:subclass B1 metallo-beta-lactamase [Eudoraea sp.]
CMIKALNAPKGNLNDANTEEWASTVRKIKSAYPDLEIIVPGHGKWGDITLLNYTIKLFSTH